MRLQYLTCHSLKLWLAEQCLRWFLFITPALNIRHLMVSSDWSSKQSAVIRKWKASSIFENPFSYLSWISWGQFKQIFVQYLGIKLYNCEKSCFWAAHYYALVRLQGRIDQFSPSCYEFNSGSKGYFAHAVFPVIIRLSSCFSYLCIKDERGWY